MYKQLNKITFPKPTGIHINMMPIIVGDDKSLPADIRHYQSLIDQCALTKGEKAYLSINETLLDKGQIQRRPGIHTDAVNLGDGHGGWGGGWGGSSKGIYIASNDGKCRLWDTLISKVDHLGAPIEKITAEPIYCQPNTLYWITDRTPHESLSSEKIQIRQWFRLVGDAIYGWWVKHSTPNPLGIEPNAPLIFGSKF